MTHKTPAPDPVSVTISNPALSAWKVNVASGLFVAAFVMCAGNLVYDHYTHESEAASNTQSWSNQAKLNDKLSTSVDQLKQLHEDDKVQLASIWQWIRDHSK